MYKQVNIPILTSRTFHDQARNGDIPALVVFWADWCGPCHLISRMLEAAAAEFSGRLFIGKIDVDLTPGISKKFGVHTLPTLLFFSKGHIVSHATGTLSRREVLEKIEEVLHQIQTIDSDQL